MQDHPQLGLAHWRELDARRDRLLDPAHRRRRRATDRTIRDQHEQERRDAAAASASASTTGSDVVVAPSTSSSTSSMGAWRQRSVTASTTRPGSEPEPSAASTSTPSARRTYSTVPPPAAATRHASAAISSVRPEPGGPQTPESGRCRAGHRPGVTQPGQLGLSAHERRVRAQQRRQPPALGHDRRAPNPARAPDARPPATLVPAPARTTRRAHAGRAGTPPRVVLSAKCVQAAHQQRPRSLPTGFGSHQPLQLRDRGRRGPREQLGLCQILRRREAQLLEADTLRIGEGGALGVDIRGPAPLDQGVAQHGSGTASGGLSQLARAA